MATVHIQYGFTYAIASSTSEMSTIITKTTIIVTIPRNSARNSKGMVRGEIFLILKSPQENPTSARSSLIVGARVSHISVSLQVEFILTVE